MSAVEPERPLAAIDIGTNSFHLVVARVVGGNQFETITREREMVRLGAGGHGGDMKRLSEAAIDRGVEALGRLARIADGHDAHVRAVATSATREALNAAEFCARAETEAGVHVEVISGTEEARLIHLGVLQAVPVFDQRLLLVDVGGGSTELLIGESGEVLASRSLKLGAVRLTDRFFPGGIVTSKAVKACRDHVRGMIEHFARDVDKLGFDVAVASSGTAETVARMVHAATGAETLRTYNCAQFSRDALDHLVGELVTRRTPPARSKLAGLETARADIIVAGALILATIASTFEVSAFTFSEAALREGVLLDTLSRRSGRSVELVHPHHLRDVSRRSIRQLMDRCDDDPAHSRHVASLAVALFDALPELRDLGLAAREYLEAGALLANVGLVVSHSKHHRHAYYVVRNSELAGLTDAEIELIAQIARYHRKSEPKQSHPPFGALSPAEQSLVRSLAAVLRVAIGLDRRHDGRVSAIRLATASTGVDTIVAVGHDVELEVYAANERRGLLERVLGRPLEVVAG